MKTKRWSLTVGTRVFTTYAPTKHAANKCFADAFGIVTSVITSDVEPCGFYDNETNTIIGGEKIVTIDQRKAPGA